MPRGFWDWGVNPTGVSLTPEVSGAELAARLGSIDTFDRRGEVMFLDSFESGRPAWSTNLSGTGAAVRLSLARARTGAVSAVLIGGSDGARSALLIRAHPPLASAVYGLEASMNRLTTVESFSWRLWIWDGTNNTRFEVRWTEVQGVLAYRNSVGGFTTIATSVFLSPLASLFHTGKLVGNIATGRYERFTLGGVVYSLAGIAPQVVVDATDPHVETQLVVVSAAGSNDQAYLDDVILTQNEP